MNKRWQYQALGGTFAYAVLAASWIVWSDQWASKASSSIAVYEALSKSKGAVFVLLTSLLFYAVLRTLLNTESKARLQAEKAASQLEKEQQALREAEELYHTVFESVSDGIALLEADRFVDCNKRFLELFRCSREEVLKRSPTDFSPELQPDGRSSREEQLRNNQRVLAGEPRSFRWQHRRPDGSLFMAEVSLRRFTAGSRVLLLALVRDITERLQAEEALRQSEAQLRTLYHSMNEGLALHEVILGSDGKVVDYRILEVNPAYETLTGLWRDDVVGKPASEVYGTEQAPYLEMFAPVALSGQPTTFETHFAPLDKHFAISVFSPARGQFATVFADISKRREAENQICQLNQVYALISHINEAIVRISDRETLFQETCRIAADYAQFLMAWIGLVDEATGEVRPVAWAGKEEGYLASVGTTAYPTALGRGPVGLAVRDGRVIICSDIATDPRMAPWHEAALARGYRSLIALPLKLGNRVIGALAVYASEPNFFTAIITESLIEVAADISFALELFERNRQRELEQEQLRLQHSALEAAANAILITDRAGVIQWVNEAFCRVTGYSRAEVIGQSPRMLHSGQHEKEFYRQMWQTVLAGSVWQGALTNRRKDGALYHEEMTITPVRSAAGDITHFIAIKQDVSERKKLEQQFLRAQRMQSVGLLAGGVAHDLNNVLTPVLMALPLLRDPMEPHQRDYILSTLEQSVQRGAKIIQQVLTFARGVEVQRGPVQLRHLIKDIAKIAQETFPREISVSLNVPSNLWPFLGDPTQMHQVLLNLAVNARDAMPEGGQLGFSARNIELPAPLQFQDFEIPAGQYVSLSVSDTGTGIAPEHLERIFEPFFTTKPVGQGTGLGLSSVMGIVKSHHGLVEVKTQMGSGATFTVFLPAAVEKAEPAEGTQSAVAPSGQGETILVVDDEPGILEVTKSLLEASGYQVMTANNGAVALDLAAAHRETLKGVLTDIMMPVLDGVALTACLRKSWPGLPVVVMTGLIRPPGLEGRESHLRELGVKHFLRKPFEADELLTLVRQALEESK